MTMLHNMHYILINPSYVSNFQTKNIPSPEKNLTYTFTPFFIHTNSYKIVHFFSLSTIGTGRQLFLNQGFRKKITEREPTDAIREIFLHNARNNKYLKCLSNHQQEGGDSKTICIAERQKTTSELSVRNPGTKKNVLTCKTDSRLHPGWNELVRK